MRSSTPSCSHPAAPQPPRQGSHGCTPQTHCRSPIFQGLVNGLMVPTRSPGSPNKSSIEKRWKCPQHPLTLPCHWQSCHLLPAPSASLPGLMPFASTAPCCGAKGGVSQKAMAEPVPLLLALDSLPPPFSYGQHEVSSAHREHGEPRASSSPRVGPLQPCAYAARLAPLLPSSYDKVTPI